MKVRIKANDGHWRTRLTEALAEMGYTVRVIKDSTISIPDIYDRCNYYVELDGPEGDITIPPENAKLVKKEAGNNEAR
jgi:hypothetical protein